jgi:hypothetical protein
MRERQIWGTGCVRVAMLGMFRQRLTRAGRYIVGLSIDDWDNRQATLSRSYCDRSEVKRAAPFRGGVGFRSRKEWQARRCSRGVYRKTKGETVITVQANRRAFPGGAEGHEW